MTKVIPTKALITLLICANLFAVYELLGIHSPQPFNYLTGFIYAIGIAVLIAPATLILAFLWSLVSTKGFKRCFVSLYKLFLNINSLAMIVLVVYLVFESDDLDYIHTNPITYKIESNINSSDAAILKERLTNILPSRYSRVFIDIENSKITFLRGYPNEDMITFVSQQKGDVRVTPKGSHSIWLNNSHIERVNATTNIYGTESLAILLTQEGGTLLYDRTKNGFKDPIILRIDDEIISESTTSSPLGIAITIPVIDGFDSEHYALLMNTGPLSHSIKLKKI